MPTVDRADLWWRIAAGHAALHRQHSDVPPQWQAASVTAPEPWRWHYSWWFGLMYGPIPISSPLAFVLWLLVYASRQP